MFKITNDVLCRELTACLEHLEWTEDREKLGLRVIKYVSVSYYFL